jgi:hypothetical protein
MAEDYKRSKVNIEERTLMKRINRFLAEQKGGRKLCKNKGSRSGEGLTDREKKLGKFYIVSDKKVVQHHVNIERFARQNEVMHSYEVLAAV